MTRKGRIFLGISAVSGAVLTAWLVVHLLGEDGARDYTRGAGRPVAERDVRSPQRGGGRVVQTVDEEYPKDAPRYPSPMRTVRPGEREPFDSPETRERRAQESAQVLRLLEQIREGDLKDPSRNQALFLELQKLVRSLGYRLSRTTRDELVSLMETIEPKWRPLIGQTLGNLRGDVETAGILMAKLEGRPDDLYTRRALLTALTNMEVPEVLPRLGKMLGTAFEEEHLVARAIGRIGGEEATAMLLDYLEKEPIRGTTAREIERLLGSAANPKLIVRIEEGLSSPSASKRRSMLNVLAAARSERSGEAVRELLARERDPSVRSAAIRALGNIGDPDSGKALLDLIDQGDAAQKSQAINAIHTIRNPKTVAAIAKDWNSLSDSAQFAVIGAAARLPRPSEDLVEIAQTSLRNNNERVRNAAVTVLGATGDEKHVGTIGSYLRGSKTTRERSVALQALRRIGTEKAAEEALRSLGAIPAGPQRERYEQEFERMRKQREEMRLNAAGANR